MQGITTMTDSVHPKEDGVSQKNTPPQPTPVNTGKPNLGDTLFLIFLACMLGLVAWVGVLAYRDGLKNENTKNNGEAWVKWLKESSEPRMQENFAIESCSASTDETAVG